MKRQFSTKALLKSNTFFIHFPFIINWYYVRMPSYRSIKRERTPPSNFFQVVSVNQFTFGITDGTQPDVIMPFMSQGFSLINYSTASNNIVEYSFDGINVHGDLVPGSPSAALVFDYRTAGPIWFRLRAGASGPINVRVEGWSK
jgi:hypothetical protein